MSKDERNTIKVYDSDLEIFLDIKKALEEHKGKKLANHIVFRKICKFYLVAGA